MLLIKTSLVIAATFLFTNTIGLAACGRAGYKQADGVENISKPSAQPSTGSRKDSEVANSEMKVLAEGSHSEVTSPFLVVAREPGTYAELRKLVPGLPQLLDEFFKSQVVVAAFMGERNTGGYSVEMTRAADGVIRVAANSPPKGAMVTQVITAPFKVVSIPSSPWLGLEAEGVWQQAMHSYRVTSGDFTMSGGFAGRREQFGLEGAIRVMRAGKLATFFFDLQSSGGEKQRSLKEPISGLVENGQITIYLMGAGSLIETPHGNLSASGTFTDKDRALALSFKSLPTMISDGFAGEGTVEAEAATSAPQKKQLVGSNPI